MRSPGKISLLPLSFGKSAVWRRFAPFGVDLRIVLIVLCLAGQPMHGLAAQHVLQGQETPPVSNAVADALDPLPLVRDASFNELHPVSGGKHPYRYRLRKTDEKGVNVKEIIETPDGDVARLLSRNDQPLTPQAEQAELDRLNNLLAHPEIQQRRHKKEQEDSDRADTMIKLLPSAFNYTYLGTTEGRSGPAYRLGFVPNPRFVPPNHEAQVYHAMAGELWIDMREKRMSRFQAHLISDVDFVWGIGARLNKGGTILVEQEDVGDGHWEAVNFQLNLTGKILMMKSLDMKTWEQSTDFVEIPAGTDLQGAIRILESLPPDR